MEKVNIELIKIFGPSVLKVSIPETIVSNLNNYIDEIIKNKERSFIDMFLEDQVDFIAKYINEKKSEIGVFLNHLKHYSILHFETSENYMKSYLKFEFMPGRYLGTVLVKS